MMCLFYSVKQIIFTRFFMGNILKVNPIKKIFFLKKKLPSLRTQKP